MKNKPILFLLALMLCVGAFAFPITAYAASDTTPPTLTAKLSGEVLHIEATDADSGVEAVFIDGNRINYRVDSALDVILKDYAGTGEYVKIYAMDFAGNKSKEVQIKNPYYVAPAPVPATPKPTTPPPDPETEPEPAETTPPAESSVQESKPFTPDGAGTTVDNATDGDGKEFFTISTPDENVFYLIIDRQRESENVYFLNAVTEEDLLSLAKESDGKSGESAVPTPEPTPQPNPTPEPTPEPEPEAPAKNNTGTMVFLLLAVAAAGGAGYYFKILKPKQQAQQADEFDEDEDDYEDDYTDAPDEDEDFYLPDDGELSTDSIPEDKE